jgi:hypothetical protein
MIFNNEEIEVLKVEAFFNKSKRYIDIFLKDGISISLNFKNTDFNPKNLELNKKVNLNDYIYWDTSLKTKESYYLFDISKDVVNLTRLEDNLYSIEIDIEKPDMIYTPLGDNISFNNLKTNTDFSFIY